ncbi:hypothetical protein HDU96_009355 [Phlyctochytrium bullatum]|nr:hypothetical protein HDU96_009355 [Phlyctochytrium bullatum]
MAAAAAATPTPEPEQRDDDTSRAESDKPGKAPRSDAGHDAQSITSVKSSLAIGEIVKASGKDEKTAADSKEAENGSDASVEKDRDQEETGEAPGSVGGLVGAAFTDDTLPRVAALIADEELARKLAAEEQDERPLPAPPTAAGHSAPDQAFSSPSPLTPSTPATTGPTRSFVKRVETITYRPNPNNPGSMIRFKRTTVTTTTVRTREGGIAGTTSRIEPGEEVLSVVEETTEETDETSAPPASTDTSSPQNQPSAHDLSPSDLPSYDDVVGTSAVGNATPPVVITNADADEAVVVSAPGTPRTPITPSQPASEKRRLDPNTGPQPVPTTSEKRALYGDGSDSPADRGRLGAPVDGEAAGAAGRGVSPARSITNLFQLPSASDVAAAAAAAAGASGASASLEASAPENPEDEDAQLRLALAASEEEAAVIAAAAAADTADEALAAGISFEELLLDGEGLGGSSGSGRGTLRKGKTVKGGLMEYTDMYRSTADGVLELCGVPALVVAKKSALEQKREDLGAMKQRAEALKKKRIKDAQDVTDIAGLSFKALRARMTGRIRQAKMEEVSELEATTETLVQLTLEISSREQEVENDALELLTLEEKNAELVRCQKELIQFLNMAFDAITNPADVKLLSDLEKVRKTIVQHDSHLKQVMQARQHLHAASSHLARAQDVLRKFVEHNVRMFPIGRAAGIWPSEVASKHLGYAKACLVEMKFGLAEVPVPPGSEKVDVTMDRIISHNIIPTPPAAPQGVPLVVPPGTPPYTVPPMSIAALLQCRNDTDLVRARADTALKWLYDSVIHIQKVRDRFRPALVDARRALVVHRILEFEMSAAEQDGELEPIRRAITAASRATALSLREGEDVAGPLRIDTQRKGGATTANSNTTTGSPAPSPSVTATGGVDTPSVATSNSSGTAAGSGGAKEAFDPIAEAAAASRRNVMRSATSATVSGHDVLQPSNTITRAGMWKRAMQAPVPPPSASATPTSADAGPSSSASSIRASLDQARGSLDRWSRSTTVRSRDSHMSNGSVGSSSNGSGDGALSRALTTSTVGVGVTGASGGVVCEPLDEEEEETPMVDPFRLLPESGIVEDMAVGGAIEVVEIPADASVANEWELKFVVI